MVFAYISTPIISLNIPTTDRVLWNKIVDILSDTIELKKNLKKRTLIGMSIKSRELKREVNTREEKILELTKTKLDLEKGLVEVETNKIINKYPSEEIYHSFKKELTKRYNQTKSLIEDIRNSLREIGNRERWFEQLIITIRRKSTYFISSSGYQFSMW